MRDKNIKIQWINRKKSDFKKVQEFDKTKDEQKMKNVKMKKF